MPYLVCINCQHISSDLVAECQSCGARAMRKNVLGDWCVDRLEEMSPTDHDMVLHYLAGYAPDTLAHALDYRRAMVTRMAAPELPEDLEEPFFESVDTSWCSECGDEFPDDVIRTCGECDANICPDCRDTFGTCHVEWADTYGYPGYRV